MPEPTDAELYEQWCGAVETHVTTRDFVCAFARAVLAKWGTPTAGEPVAYRHMHDDGWEYYDAPTGSDCPGCEALCKCTQPVVREPLTADDLRMPKDGQQWRVEWWNESCRMLLPANKKLDSFQAYKTGTLMFTIKERGTTQKGGQHG